MRDTQNYHYLLRDFAHATSLADPEHFLSTGLIQVDGLTMLLHYDEDRMPNHVLLRMDLGEIRGDKERTLFNLLVSNFIMGMLGIYVFSIDPSHGHIILTVQLELGRLRRTARRLLGCPTDRRRLAGPGLSGPGSRTPRQRPDRGGDLAAAGDRRCTRPAQAQRGRCPCRDERQRRDLLWPLRNQ